MPILDYRKGTVSGRPRLHQRREALMLSEFYNVAEGIGSRTSAPVGARQTNLQRSVIGSDTPLRSAVLGLR
jgi:hypothetical protein